LNYFIQFYSIKFTQYCKNSDLKNKTKREREKKKKKDMTVLVCRNHNCGSVDLRISTRWYCGNSFTVTAHLWYFRHGLKTFLYF